MARIFPDTSAPVKLYRTAPNSAAVQSCVTVADELVIAQITPLEYRSAFYGLVRQKFLALPDAQNFIYAFLHDLPQYKIIPADEAVFQQAATLLDVYSASVSLRPLDALQLAGALIENSHNPIDIFLTTDKTLASVAIASGLTVKP